MDAVLSTIGEIELRDEFALLPHNAVLSDVAKALSPVKNTAALIRSPKAKGIQGVVKVQMLLKSLASGIDPMKVKASDIMGDDLLRLRADMPIEKALETISDRNPDAVLVLDSENVFVGFLSTEDFRLIKNQYDIGMGN